LTVCIVIGVAASKDISLVTKWLSPILSSAFAGGSTFSSAGGWFFNYETCKTAMIKPTEALRDKYQSDDLCGLVER